MYKNYIWTQVRSLYIFDDEPGFGSREYFTAYSMVKPLILLILSVFSG